MDKQREKDDEMADALLKRVHTLEGNRGTLDSHLQEISERVLPSYSRQFLSGGTPNATKGDKRNDVMYDSTAALSLTKFAAVMESILTPRGSRWHRTVPVDKILARNRLVREWFEDTTDLLFAYRYSANANYASQKQEDYIQLGAFGTGNLFIDKRANGPGLRYKSCSLADLYFGVNHEGRVDEVHRRLILTARQAMQKWGADRLPDQIVNAAKTSPDSEFVFWHCAKPREEVDPNRADYKGMPFASYYVSVTGKRLLEEGGYRSFPYSVSRHIVAPGETYGRSPAMLVLPNIKTLNDMKKTVLKQGHRAVDPVLLAHDDGVMDGMTLKPGAVNYGAVNADGRPLVHALPVGNLHLAHEMMDEERKVIKDAFYVTLFEILVEDRREMTATEVLERAREKGVLLAPAAGRQWEESLNPQIEREIDLLAQQGLLPPMPPILAQAQAEWKAEYDSPLAKMARSEEASGFLQLLDVATRVATEAQDPSALDWLDVDTAMPEIADIKAVPIRWIRTMEAVLAKRQGRDQAAAQQKLIEAAPAAASVISSLSKPGVKQVA